MPLYPKPPKRNSSKALKKSLGVPTERRRQPSRKSDSFHKRTTVGASGLRGFGNRGFGLRFRVFRGLFMGGGVLGYMETTKIEASYHT